MSALRVLKLDELDLVAGGYTPAPDDSVPRPIGPLGPWVLRPGNDPWRIVNTGNPVTLPPIQRNGG